MTEKTLGGCQCGKIRYEVDEPPHQVGYCHCNMCRKSVGNLFATWAFVDRNKFRFTKEEPAWYTLTTAKRGFCPQCGSPICWQHLVSDYFSVTAGSLDEPERFEPQAHYNLAEKISWVDIHSNLRDATEEGPSRIFNTYDQD